MTWRNFLFLGEFCDVAENVEGLHDDALRFSDHLDAHDLFLGGALLASHVQCYWPNLVGGCLFI